MTARRNLVVVFKGGEKELLSILKKIGKFKAPIKLSTRRGDCILETKLSPTTIKNLFADWNVKHQTEKRIVLNKE